MSNWSNRFSFSMSKQFRNFTMSINLDKRLALIDIICNIAYCSSLYYSGFISLFTKVGLVIELLRLFTYIRTGYISWIKNYEDIHLNIENSLSLLNSNFSNVLRTARSRNDLTSTSLRVWVKQKIKNIFCYLKKLINNFLSLSVSSINIIIPSFTHFQIAQPVLLSHYFLCYKNMFFRDLVRLKNSYFFTDILPLGCGAVSGTSFYIDRFELMKRLGFSSLFDNSIDAVSDRDYIFDFCFSCSMISLHISRFCEEIIIWSNKIFDFVILSDLYSSGSSMMPQKKNPDAFELLRAKAGLIISNLFSIFLIIKNLPLSYNKDYQEDKSIVFNVSDTIISSLKILSNMIVSLTFNANKMYFCSSLDFSVATDLSEYLTRNGLSYKESHQLVSSLINKFYSFGDFKNIPLSELFSFSNNKYLFKFISSYTLESIVNSKVTFGGTSKSNVISSIKRSFRDLIFLKI